MSQTQIKLTRILAILLIFSFISFMGYGQILAPPLHYWDFAEGITSEWVSESNTPIAHWEYRGPDTEPDNTVCSQGSCGASSVPITSITASNGFVIFDSNYWDDDDGVCGGLGTGQDPAPHLASLITPSVNLTGISTVVLTFQQQYKHYQSNTKVFVSNNGGSSWTEVLSNTGSFSTNSEWKTVNISAQAGGFSDVKIKFQFSGIYYWWLLDDIALYSPNPNDLQLTNPAYSQYGILVSPILFNDMMYSMYPLTMIPSLKFSGTATNIGGNTQTQTKLFVDVKRDNITTTYSNSSVASTLNAGQTSLIQLNTLYNTGPQLGEYVVYYNLDQLQNDDNILNNKDTLNYFITPHTYARDEGVLEDIFNPQAMYNTQAMEVGNVFQARASGLQFASIETILGEGTVAGTEIYGIVWNLDRTEILGQSDPYTINITDINSSGGDNSIVLPLQNPITLLNDSLYLVMVGTSANAGNLRVGRSGAAAAEASLVRYPDSNGLFYMLRTPMVRMNIFAANAVPGCMLSTASNYSALATIDDGSCLFPGCTIEGSSNYDPLANWDNGTCLYCGCTNELATNYDPNASCEDGSCIILGCTDPLADNYNVEANSEDNSCFYLGCTISGADNYDSSATIDDDSCIFSGCTDPEASNFDPQANLNNGTCLFPGCTHPLADNFDTSANIDDGSCILSGCTDPDAANFWDEANTDDGSCLSPGCTDPLADNFDPGANAEDGTCIYFGCTDPLANNFDPGANSEDLSCEYNTAMLATENLSGCAPFTFTIINQTVITEGAICEIVIENIQTWNTCESEYTVTLETPGTYEVTYTYSQGNNISIFTLGPIDVFATPEIPQLNWDGNLELVCENCSIGDYIWWNDGSIVSEVDSPILDVPLTTEGVTDNGFYHLEFLNTQGCTAISDSVLILDISITSVEDTLCEGSEFLWFNSTDYVQGAQLIFDFGDETYTATVGFTYNHEYPQAGLYEWSIMYSYEDFSTTTSGNILVVENPEIPEITVDTENSLLICSNSLNVDSIHWNVNGVDHFNVTEVDFLEGAYYVEFINENLCFSSISGEYVSVENTSIDGLQYFPNPTDNELTIVSPNEIESFSIFNSIGDKVYSTGNLLGTNTINTGDLSPGIYEVLVVTFGRPTTFKMVVVH